MVRYRKPRRIYLLSVIALILHHQWSVCQGAGLRGVEEELRLVAESQSPPGGTLLIESPPVHHLVTMEGETRPSLLCPNSGRFDNSNCPSSGVNQTTPVCQYNPKTREYNTLCLRRLSDTLKLPNAHRKSYCGPCRACFEDKDELQIAVNKYKSYKVVHIDLAENYGWPIGRWCVEKVTSFSNLFFKKNKFDEDINAWETSQVTDMTSMFQNAYAFNKPLDRWDTSRVKSMTRMFAMAIRFNQDIGSWDVSSVTDTSHMFLHSLEFEQDLSDWQVHNAQSLNSMFFGAIKFNHSVVQNWPFSEYADTENMCEWDQQQPDEAHQKGA